MVGKKYMNKSAGLMILSVEKLMLPAELENAKYTCSKH